MLENGSFSYVVSEKQAVLFWAVFAGPQALVVAGPSQKSVEKNIPSWWIVKFNGYSSRIHTEQKTETSIKTLMKTKAALICQSSIENFRFKVCRWLLRRTDAVRVTAGQFQLRSTREHFHSI